MLNEAEKLRVELTNVLSEKEIAYGKVLNLVQELAEQDEDNVD